MLIPAYWQGSVPILFTSESEVISINNRAKKKSDKRVCVERGNKKVVVGSTRRIII